MLSFWQSHWAGWIVLSFHLVASAEDCLCLIFLNIFGLTNHIRYRVIIPHPHGQPSALKGKPLALILQLQEKGSSLSTIYSVGLKGTCELHGLGSICAMKSGLGQSEYLHLHVNQLSWHSLSRGWQLLVLLSLPAAWAFLPPRHIRMLHVSLPASSHWAGSKWWVSYNVTTFSSFYYPFITLLLPLLFANELFSLN